MISLTLTIQTQILLLSVKEKPQVMSVESGQQQEMLEGFRERSNRKYMLIVVLLSLLSPATYLQLMQLRK